MGKGNNMIPNAHFHKYWQKHVRTWFNQPARKQRRRQERAKKAKAVFPRPSSGALRPIVRCPSIKYHTKQRVGRGFTVAEIKGAGLTPGFARTVGIAVDRRRQNKSVESRQANIQRLKEYRSKLILFPINNKKKLQKGEADADARKMATQLRGPLMPLKKEKPALEFRGITEEDKAFQAFTILRRARVDARLLGRREKLAREAAENVEDGKGGKDAKKAKK